MFYKKVETYSFTLPGEYYDYLRFKERLIELGTPFIEEGGSIRQTIIVTTSGRFVMDEGEMKQWT